MAPARRRRAAPLRGGRASTGAVRCAFLPSAGARGDPCVVRTVAATQRLSRSVRIVAAQRERNRRSVSVPDSPPFSPDGLGRDRSRRCRLVVAPLKPRGMPAASGPCRCRHAGARTPGKPDGSHRLLRCYGPVAQTVCCRDRPAQLRGLGTRGRLVAPAALSQGLLAALPLRDRGAVRSPLGSLPSVGRSPVAGGGTAFRASRRCACRSIAPGLRLRGCPRAGGHRRPRYAFVSHALAACGHAPEPRTGAPVQASVRRASDAARTGRSNVAARGGAGLVAAEIMDAAA